MPRIPLLEAQRAPGLVSLPRPTAATFGGPGFAALTGFGEALQKVAQTLQAEQDKLDLAEDVGWFEGKVKETKLALAFDPDYRTHTQKFTEAVQGFQRELAERPRSASVRQTLDAHINKTIPTETVNVQADALKLWTSQQRAALDRQEAALSQRAAEAPTPEARDQSTALFEGLVAGLVNARILTPVEGEQQRQRFRQTAATKHMDLVARTNPAEVFRLDREGAFADVDPLKRQQILDATVTRMEAAERARERERKARSAQLRDQFYDQALQGTLRAETLEAFGPNGTRELFGEDYRDTRLLLQKQFEAGGVDTPSVVHETRRDLRLGRIGSQAEIQRKVGQGLTQATANVLLGEFRQTQDADHPSKDPAFAYYRGLLVQQVTGRAGFTAQMESLLSDAERARLDEAMDQYWERVVDKRQAPRDVYKALLEDVVGRAPVKLPPREQPRYASPIDAMTAKDRGLITQEELVEELRRQKAIADRAAQPVTTPTPKPGLFGGGGRK